MKKKPEAYHFTETPGFFTERCKTKLEAKKAIEELIKGDPDHEGLEIRIEDIKQEVAYYHRRCGCTTIGENICIECGEQTQGNGRVTFAYYIL